MALILSPNKEDKDKQYKKLKKQMENMDIVRYTIRIPTHIHTKFKTRLSAQRKTMKDFIMEMILKYLDKEDE
jgi:hypothetical protein